MLPVYVEILDVIKNSSLASQQLFFLSFCSLRFRRAAAGRQQTDKLALRDSSESEYLFVCSFSFFFVFNQNYGSLLFLQVRRVRGSSFHCAPSFCGGSRAREAPLLGAVMLGVGVLERRGGVGRTGWIQSSLRSCWGIMLLASATHCVDVHP